MPGPLWFVVTLLFMNRQSAFSWKLPILAGIVLGLSLHPAFAQYNYGGSQYQSPSPMVAGVNTQLSIQPGQAVYPTPAPPACSAIGFPVSVYGTYTWSMTNGANTWPYGTTFTCSNGYSSQVSLAYNPGNATTTATVAQLVQDGGGAGYFLTSEYYKHFNGDTWDLVLVGYYLHAAGQVVALANAPLRLAVAGSATDCSAQVFVLETDASNHGVVEGFKLTNPTPGCGPWYRFGSLALPAGTPVDLGIAGGQIAVLGYRTIQCTIGGGQVSGLGGFLYIFPESLASAGSPDYTACRPDGNFLLLKGFAKDATDGVAVASNQIYLFGDLLWTTGTYHLAYNFWKHSLTASGFVDGGAYPAPVPPPPPQPTDHAGRHSFSRTSTLSSVGVSTGAVLDSTNGYLYITGSATPDGYNQGAKTAQFYAAGGYRQVLSHPYPNSAGIALDNGKIYVGAGGQTGTGTWALAFQGYQSAATPTSAGSGQSTTSFNTVPTSFLLRRYSNHLPDVFLGGSLVSPDSQHMYTGVVTQFSVWP